MNMSQNQMVQKVIDFEFSRLHLRTDPAMPAQNKKQDLNKYGTWCLSSIIQQLGLADSDQMSIKWIGCDPSSHFDAFLYALLQGCRNLEPEIPGTFISLKYCLYELGIKFLDKQNQKNLVQTLCGAQYAPNLALYLSGNKNLESLFSRLCKNYVFSTNAGKQNALSQLEQVAQAFQFVKLHPINSNSTLVENNGIRTYILCQKGCYFVLETKTQRNQGAHNKKEVPVFYNRLNRQVAPQIVLKDNKKAISSAIPKFLLKKPKDINNNVDKNQERYGRLFQNFSAHNSKQKRQLIKYYNNICHRETGSTNQVRVRQKTEASDKSDLLDANNYLKSRDLDWMQDVEPEKRLKTQFCIGSQNLKNDFSRVLNLGYLAKSPRQMSLKSKQSLYSLQESQKFSKVKNLFQLKQRFSANHNICSNSTQDSKQQAWQRTDRVFV